MNSHMVVEKAEGKRAKIMQLVIDGVSNLNTGLTHSKTHICLLFTYLPINLFFFLLILERSFSLWYQFQEKA